MDFKDFSKWQELLNTGTLRIYSQLLFHAGLKRQLRVVCILRYVKAKDGKIKEKRELFFSTDTTQTAQDSLDIYHARFHIEFCFREKSLQQGVASRYRGYADDQSIPAVEDSLPSNSQVCLTVNHVNLKPLTFTGIWLS